MSARTEATCLTDAMRFDWDTWNRKFDADMAALQQTLAKLNETEAAIAAERQSMARDLRAIIGEALA